MYGLIRSLLFKLKPERAHALALSVLRYIPAWCLPIPSVRPQPIHALGLEFPHAIGLAAGFDKNGEYLDSLAKLGFSFIEVGTVTPRPQLGNPKPRLFRLPASHAIINRMGFNNQGVDALLTHLSRSRYSGILGINLGKNKDTPLENAAEDYCYGLQRVYSRASYVTINISSPNTPDLRQLQQGRYFSELMHRLREEQLHLSDVHQRYVPLVVKLSPDEPAEALKRMAEVILQLGMDGIIATNTTCSREDVATDRDANEMGGLSGRPLFSRATSSLRVLKEVVGDRVTLIGSGGIDSVARAREKQKAGATLLQVYTGLIYQGPLLVKQLISSPDYSAIG